MTTRIDREPRAANQAPGAVEANSLRPYPENLARMPANRRANAAAAVAAAAIIPPEQRAVVAGCSEHCRSCAAFTRSGGSCPGVRNGGAGVLGGAGVSPARRNTGGPLTQGVKGGTPVPPKNEPPICHSRFAQEDDR